MATILYVALGPWLEALILPITEAIKELFVKKMLCHDRGSNEHPGGGLGTVKKF